MRQVRKLADVIDEQNASIDAVNDKLDNFDISGVETDIANLKKTVGQVEISTEENTTHLTTVDSTLDNHAREINTIKAKDVSQDSEIQGLSESVVSDLTGEFNNDTRVLKLSIERESAPSIDCDVVIPSGGTTGQYTSGNGIDINSNNVISAKIDNSTIKVNASGQMYSVGGGSGGKTYTAGTGINISDSDVISVKTDVVALKSDISDMETKTDANSTFATKTEFNTLKGSVGDAIKPIDIENNKYTVRINMESLDGQQNSIVFPSASDSSAGIINIDEYIPLSLFIGGADEGFYTNVETALIPSVDNTTIHYNSNNQLEVIGGGSSSDKNWVEIDLTNMQFTYVENANGEITKGYKQVTSTTKSNYVGSKQAPATVGGFTLDYFCKGVADYSYSTTPTTKTLYVMINCQKAVINVLRNRINYYLEKAKGSQYIVSISGKLWFRFLSTPDGTANLYRQSNGSDFIFSADIDSNRLLNISITTLNSNYIASDIQLYGKTVDVEMEGSVTDIVISQD